MAERIGDAYGLVLLLIMVTFVVMMTLPPQGWGGRVAAVAIAGLTAVVAFTSSDVRPCGCASQPRSGRRRRRRGGRPAVPSEPLLSVAFGVVATMLAIAAVTIMRRVIVGAKEVDFRTILGAISVSTLLGLLFAFLYFASGRWSHDPSSPAQRRASSDYLFFSYTTLTTTGYGNLVPAGTLGQSFAVLEMLVGQIFLVTLVAGLVSLWRPGSSRNAAAGTEA